MAESIIFLKSSLQEAIERYKSVIEGGELEKIPEKEVYMYEGVYMYSLSDEWVALETENGDFYAIEILEKIAKENKCIYTYINEDLLEGELVVIEDEKIKRKLFDYYSTPELNENVGRIEYEEMKEINDWVSIGEYMDYLYEAL